MRRLILLTLGVASIQLFGYTRYVFSPDGVRHASSPVNLPTIGRNYETGDSIKLSELSPSELVKCGWYRVIPQTNIALKAYQYPVIKGYKFDKESGTALQYIEIKDGAPKVIYTQFKIIGLMRRLGKWSQFKNYLISEDMYDLFISAQYISNDSDEFMMMKPLIAKFLDIDLFELDKILETCKDN